MHPICIRLLENQRGAFRLLVSTADHGLASMHFVALYSSGKGRHTPAQNVYSAWVLIAPWSCKLCIPALKQPSSWSWLFCGKLVLSDHRIQTACDHIGAFLARLMKPWRGKKTLSVASTESSRVSHCKPFQLCIGLLYAGYASCNPCLCSRCGGF